jgi:hypothetical protein
MAKNLAIVEDDCFYIRRLVVTIAGHSTLLFLFSSGTGSPSTGQMQIRDTMLHDSARRVKITA